MTLGHVNKVLIALSALIERQKPTSKKANYFKTILIENMLYAFTTIYTGRLTKLYAQQLLESNLGYSCIDRKRY